MPFRDSPGTRPTQALWQAALAFGSLFLISTLAVALSRTNSTIAAIWPSNAVLLAMVLLRPARLWPMILAGGYAGNVVANLTGGDSLAQAAVLAACNLSEVLLCVAALRRWAGPAIDLTRPRDFALFSTMSVVAPIASSLLAGGYLRLVGADITLHSTFTWGLADSLGLFILTPALLILGRRRNRAALAQSLRSRKRLPVLLFAGLLIATAVGPYHSAILLAPPILVMLALEYELAGAAAAMLVLSLVAYGFALVGLEPTIFPGDSRDRLLRLQGFLAIVATVILPLGSVVSQRSAWRRTLADARDRAEAGAAAKSEFLANMSHELRTPLTSIIGFAGLLREEALDERQSRYVGRIADASHALLAVINDVLDFSKLEAGELTLDPQPTQPEALIRQTVALVSIQAEAKGLGLKIATSGLPAAVMVDEGRLRQVLLNLLSNAVKFTEAGEVRVTAGYARETGRLTVSVADTGPGVAPNRMDRLFQRFSQADGSISRRFGGSGLGLAICRSLVELMDGDIDVESRVGKGATFTFQVSAPVVAPAAETPSAAEIRYDRGAASVLLVDDVASIRELVRTVLESMGVRVVEAHDGVGAVYAAGAERYDLILMDVRMPGVDGLAATRAIRDGDGPNRATPILALTADVQQGDVDACHGAGMNDHIAKPIAVAELLTKTARWTKAFGASGVVS